MAAGTPLHSLFFGLTPAILCYSCLHNICGRVCSRVLCASCIVVHVPLLGVSLPYRLGKRRPRPNRWPVRKCPRSPPPPSPTTTALVATTSIMPCLLPRVVRTMTDTTSPTSTCCWRRSKPMHLSQFSLLLFWFAFRVSLLGHAVDCDVD